MASFTLLRSQAMIIASPSPREVAIGFSHTTAFGLPVAAAIVISACCGSQEQTLTMSSSSFAIISR